MSDDFACTKSTHQAMATLFEILIADMDETQAKQASVAAFDEVDRIEKKLTRFEDGSDISQINHATPNEPVRVSIYTVECLKVAIQMYHETGGAFDVTIGPLMKCWRNPDRSLRQPSDQELAEARSKVGSHLLVIDEANLSVSVKVRGVEVDLGGIGKGYAVEKVIDILEDWDVKAALINGGDSTVRAMAAPSGKTGWPVGVGGVADDPVPRRKIQLCRNALSGSGFAVRGRHIMDPRTGRPVEAKCAAWSLCPSATIADCLSTAFIVMSSEEVEAYCKKHPDTSAMLVFPGQKQEVLTFGAW